MNRTSRRPRRFGQILPGAIIAMLILAILLTLMVVYAQRESTWSVKQAQSTTALHLAEAGVEKAYLAVSLSSQTWGELQKGFPIAGYNFDQEYSDLSGGTYAISITSGPGTQQATVLSVARDAHKHETRAIRAVYSNSPLGGTAIYSGRGAQVGGNVTVEWGAVISPYGLVASLTSPGPFHPQFWSASSIQPWSTSPNPPLCDSPNCCQWHSFQKTLPPAPAIDLSFYASSAAASNCSGIAGISGSPSGCAPGVPTCCYFNTSQTFTGVSTSSQTIFVNGDLTIASPGIDVVGNLIVTGNVNLPHGAWGDGTHVMSVPSDAWKQYCNDWVFYRTTYDPGAPATFPGFSSNYAPTGLTYTSSKLAVSGLLYVGGNFNNNSGGGGNSDIYGALYAIGSSTDTSHSNVHFYFNAAAAQNLQTTQIILSRTSWQDSLTPWPKTLP